MKKIDDKGANFEEWRAELLRQFLKITEEPAVEAIIPFTNDDVPKFLKRLDRFEKKSRKSDLVVC